jgi:hypothetical protein
MYDVIIIGAGISGLYTAYKLLQQNPNISIYILEKHTIIGGRAGNIIYEGQEIVTGAGIGRFEKDFLLKKLMTDFTFPINDFIVKHNYDKVWNKDEKDPILFMKDIFTTLINEYKKNPVKTTFKDFAQSIIGKKNYKKFILYAGFTDFEKEDVYDTLFYYNFDDNMTSWKGFSVPWKKLIDKMSIKIGLDKIKINSTVINIKRNLDETFEILTMELQNKFVYEKIYQTKKVIIATTISFVQSIFSLSPTHSMIYNQIKGQPFFRVYAKFTDSNSIKYMNKYVKTMTIVNGPLQKILPISPKNGIYMISYSDNKNAIFLEHYFNKPTINCFIFSRLIENALGLPLHSIKIYSILGLFFDIGTHYYKPLTHIKNRKKFIKKAQRPLPNMFIVGEMVSINQGWVEGALESVETIYEEIVE